MINADEGEPGTFKDRLIMTGPHLLIEGIIITSYALSVHNAYIYIRGEFVREARIVQEAIDEAYAKGYSVRTSGGRVRPGCHRSPGGRRIHLRGGDLPINSLEGKRGWPRLKPPFPPPSAPSDPTIVNNVETIATSRGS